ncbi:hypothetical protein CLIB1444_01S18184 [[Candida] jaroonii]|uniref:Uncharacterized protein n=1 Tax=[Candida] jaroonii TaxID=467808 RepID=A0ACA9Y1W6_9ASCO|nr:hypothetical protein CLIB1444_01S18184 [[Candida] jaroonii]
MVQTRRAVSKSNTRLTRQPSGKVATKGAKASTTTTKVNNTSIDGGNTTLSTPSGRIDKTTTTPIKVRKRRNRITETEILKSSNEELIDIINDLTNTHQDEIFQQYKTTNEQRVASLEQQIDDLKTQLQQKDDLIDSLRDNNVLPSSRPNSTSDNLYISPIRKNKKVQDEVIHEDEVQKEFTTIGIVIEMFELLTSIKITDCSEDDDKLYFDILQSSISDKYEKLTIEYRIIIMKKLTVSEVEYIPLFMTHENNEKIIEILPDYLCDKLTFPHHSLSQFCSKITRALNRVKR